MRVACAVHDYPPHRSVGSARTAAEICAKLAARGHEVTVVSGARTAAAPDGAPPGPGSVRVERTRRGARNAWARHGRYRLRRWLGEDELGLAEPLTPLLLKRIRRARPDRILALAVPTPEVVAAAQSVRRLGVPGVVLPFFHIHADDFVPAEALGRWMEALRSFDVVMPLTAEEERFYLLHGLAPERLVRHAMYVEPPPSLPPEQVRAWRSRHGIGDALLVVAAGSYSAVKGVWTLARAAQALPEVRFVFLGGDLRAEQSLRAAISVGPNVSFAGPVDEGEKALWLHAADLLAMPSRGDSFGRIFVEANACGTPALAADLPSMREVLGPSGLFVAPDDETALARAILSRSASEWRSPEVAEGARKNADRFTSPASLDHVASVLERAGA